MADDVQTFIDALHTLEGDRDVDPIVALFTDDADISNPLVEHPDGGKQGVRQFWTSYRSAFDELRSEFRAIVRQDAVAMLEWRTEGSKDGKPFVYGGVSVLEYGERGIASFRTYFDPTSLATGSGS